MSGTRPRFQQHRDASCHQVFIFLQGKAPKEIHAILTETLVCFLPGRAKDLSALLCVGAQTRKRFGRAVFIILNICSNLSRVFCF